MSEHYEPSAASENQSGPVSVRIPGKQYLEPPDVGMDFGTFVKSRFVPEHVARKTPAGQRHYYAILKHVLTPEFVNHIFHIDKDVRTRLRNVPGRIYLDTVKLRDLDQDHVREIMSWASQQGYSTQTVHHIKSVIRAVMWHAIEAGLFSGPNPASAVHSPWIRRENSEQPLKIRELQNVLALLEAPESEIAFLVITMGISIQEASELNWNHVNLSNQEIFLDGELIPPKTMLIMKNVSPESSHTGMVRLRIESIPEAAVKKLAQLQDDVTNGHGDSPVFLAPGHGKQFSPEISRLKLKAVGQRLGLPRLSWQALRCAHKDLMDEFRNQVAINLLHKEWT